MKTVRLTMAQALVRFLENQYIEVDGVQNRFVRGVFIIPGHGNVVGLGQALSQEAKHLEIFHGQNEQGMAQAAVMSMYVRAVMIPVTYITLAKGHSRAYVVTEGASAVGLVVAIMLCFSHWGLVGAGFAIVISNVLDLAIILVYAGIRYGYRPSRQVLACAAVHVPIGIVAYLATCADSFMLRIGAGGVAVAASLALSLRTLYNKRAKK